MRSCTHDTVWAFFSETWLQYWWGYWLLSCMFPGSPLWFFSMAMFAVACEGLMQAYRVCFGGVLGWSFLLWPIPPRP
jgi:hypothetical protein